MNSKKAKAAKPIRSKKALNASRGPDYFRFDPEKLTIIGLDTPHKKGEHPLWDRRILFEVDDSLVRSIMKRGVMVAIRVRRDGDKVLVVDGKQRVRAAREANRRLVAMGLEPRIQVNALPFQGEDSEAVGMMIATNELRRGDDVETRAEKAKQMRDYGASDDDIAIEFGMKSPKDVNTLLSIYDMAESVRDAIFSGVLSLTAATKLTSLTREEQAAELERLKSTTPQGKRVTVAKITKSRSGKKHSFLGLRPIKKILDNADELKLTPDVVTMLRIIVGDLSPTSVKGLTQFIKDRQAQ